MEWLREEGRREGYGVEGKSVGSSTGNQEGSARHADGRREMNEGEEE